MSSLDTTVSTTGTGSTPLSTSQMTFPDPSTHCLFCHHLSPSQESNTTHMFRLHGFLIPHQEHLLVDLETLLAYLESIIEDDAQCIHCFTQRASGEAARQHMLARGHCVIDLERKEGSEYVEFYDFGGRESSGSGGDDDDDDDDDEDEGEKTFVRLDDEAVRLQSGRVVSHRKARPRPDARHYRRDGASPPPPPPPAAAITPTQPSSPPPSPPPPNTQAPTQLTHPLSNNPPSRHDLALSHLRRSDRTALAHLPAAQQRALLATQRQQASSDMRAQQSVQASLGAKGNKTLMKYFKPRVPKRKGGLHRESLRA